MTRDLQQKLDAAWVDFLCRDPFGSAILMGCRQIIDETGDVTKTMATDGENLWINPALVSRESRSALVTILTHEALHIASLHPYRRGDRDPGPWNIACDKEVNGTIQGVEAEGKLKYEWPACGGIFPAATERGQAAESLYSAAPERKDGDGDGDGDGMGGVRAPSNDPGAVEECQSRAKMRIAQAAAGVGRGNLPGEYQRLIEESLNPQTPWADLLREFIRELAKDDYSWTRPNRRYASSGFILPSLYSQRLGRIAVAIDTSGSIDSDLLNRFLCEVETIAHECKPETITLIDCDCEINSVRECEPSEPLPREFGGGGGTDFSPVFEHLDKEQDQPVCLIYLTDLLGSFPDQAPGYPVIWATIGKSEAPFGVTIHV